MKNNLKKLHYTPRTEIIDSIACSLNKCEKRNVLIIGNPGSGKTSIVESIVQMQLNKDPLLHSALVDKKFYRVSCVDIMSGSTFRGSLERKIKEMLEFAASDKNIVLVCDEIHQLVLANTDSSSSSLNILEFLKEKLAGDQISIIGMTTEKEYQEHMAGDGALIRRFAKVHLKDPSFEESLQMLKTRGKVFQDRYPDIEPLDDAMYNYILTVAKDGAETSLLDQAFDMLDTAYSSVSYQHNKVITKEIINEICKGSAISKEYEGHKMMYL
jgi:ATP-dependent Clp protease ATP-binding subunit ClpA